MLFVTFVPLHSALQQCYCGNTSFLSFLLSFMVTITEWKNAQNTIFFEPIPMFTALKLTRNAPSSKLLQIQFNHAHIETYLYIYNNYYLIVSSIDCRRTPPVGSHMVKACMERSYPCQISLSYLRQLEKRIRSFLFGSGTILTTTITVTMACKRYQRLAVTR